ncbi:MAG: phosphoglucomutase/phosphomannomutase family protein [Dehalococcoidales bacterium]|nr:MAG: phosphoglucomutase/phosphomannomutase family protein [Dehalococcoidales bacterium]
MKFGTDGWRAVIAEDFTFDNIRFCAQGVAEYLKQEGLESRGLIIGYDNRFASEDFAEAVAEVIAGNGIKVFLTPHPVPTPVISFGVAFKETAGAIIITASHNPARWNGLKLRTADGSSAPPEVIAPVEKLIDRALNAGKTNRIPIDLAREKKLVESLDLTPIYLERAAKFVDLDELRRARLKVIVDTMYGVGVGYLKTLLDSSTIDVKEINNERNPAFPGINPEPIAVNLGKLSAAIREHQADIGIAQDGDADRIGIIDEKGEFLTQFQVFALLCLYLLEVRGERGPVVKTITSTSMVDRLGEIYNVPVYETAVGFQYVAPVMVAEDAIIGGEESGGYGFKGHVPERDSVVAALYFLDFMVKTSKTPAQLLEYLYSKVGPHYYHRTDIHFPEDKRVRILTRMRENYPDTIDGVRVVKRDTTDGFRFILADKTWLLIRFSGTEPVLRVYAESDSMARVERLLELGMQLAGVSA